MKNKKIIKKGETQDAYDALVYSIGTVLEDARKNAYSEINKILVKMYWEIGKRIIEYEQKGKEKADYGSELLKILSRNLKLRYGKGFSKSNVYLMRLFYLSYPKFQTVSGKLSWRHSCLLLSTSNKQARQFYEKEPISSKWATRELERQINSSVFERLNLSRHFSQQLRFNTDLTSSFMHFFVISNEDRISDFGASYEDIIETADFSGSGNINAFGKNVFFIDYFSNTLDEVCSFNSSALLSGEPGSYRCNFYNSDIRDKQTYFPLINSIHNGRGNIVNSKLFFKDSTLLFTPGFDEPLNDDTAIENTIHKSYSLSLICRINLVGSMSNLTSLLINSLSSSKDRLDFLVSNSSIIECSSLSTFFNFSMINEPSALDSAILTSPNYNNENDYLNVAEKDVIAHNDYPAASSGNIGKEAYGAAGSRREAGAWSW